jgi:hypothetical protein
MRPVGRREPGQGFTTKAATACRRRAMPGLDRTLPHGVGPMVADFLGLEHKRPATVQIDASGRSKTYASGRFYPPGPARPWAAIQRFVPQHHIMWNLSVPRLLLFVALTFAVAGSPAAQAPTPVPTTSGSAVVGRHPEAGGPIIRYYPPETYGGGAQNWMTFQDARASSMWARPAPCSNTTA